MANLSAALNSLASTTVVDFYRAAGRERAVTRARSLRLARAGHGRLGRRCCWPSAIARAPFALGAGGRPDHRVDSVGRAAGRLPAGRADAAAAAKARPWPAWWRAWRPMLCVRFATPVAFTWYVLIGTMVTFAWLACCRPRLLEARRARRTMSDETRIRTELKRDLGPWAAGSIVVGTVIGSGIFLVPRAMILRVGTPANGVRRVGIRRAALAGRRAQLRGTGGRHARRPAANMPICAKPTARCGDFCIAGRKCGWQKAAPLPHWPPAFSIIWRTFSRGSTRFFTRPAAARPARRAARNPLRPIVRHRADSVAGLAELFRREAGRRGAGGGDGGQSRR